MNITMELRKDMKKFSKYYEIRLDGKKIGSLYKFISSNPWGICFYSQDIGDVIPGAVLKYIWHYDKIEVLGRIFTRAGSVDPYTIADEMGVNIWEYKGDICRDAYRNGLIPEHIAGSIHGNVDTIEEGTKITEEMIKNRFYKGVTVREYKDGSWK